MTTVESSVGFDALVARLGATRALTESLAEPLSAADQTVQSMPDVSPTKWHRAHTTWFFEAFVLEPHAAGYRRYDDNYFYLFNSYYEAVGDRYPRVHRGMVTRPGAEEVGRYRRAVDQAVVSFLASCSADQFEFVAPLIELGINHEQQHQELLLMDIKHVLTNNLFDTAYDQRPHRPAAEVKPMAWIERPGGIIDIGVDQFDTQPDAVRFHFDNEGPRHQTLVEPHHLADRLVTCGEWLEFMADGGYDEPRHWLSDGWYTRGSEGWTAPEYWSQPEPDGPWQIHTLTGSRDVDPNEPVCHVSFYEADAYANWAGMRLPTEFEWESATGAPHTNGAELHDGSDGSPPVPASALHPVGVGVGDNDGRIRQLFGDCWEWTASAYRPYPRYRAPEGAVGEYNGKFMINTMVLRGGSALTPAGHVRPTYRNFFPPRTRWHLSGVRLAKD